MLSASSILSIHDQLTAEWHLDSRALMDCPSVNRASMDLPSLVGNQHIANCALWHTEDEARTPNAADSVIASVKRRIDKTNQLRNDLAEQIDRFLLDFLTSQGLPSAAAPLHSESPGLIIDRLSILSLKLYHTREEAERTDAPEGHAERNRQRLAILTEQRADLAACLDELWQQTLAGTRRFKLYQQLKMYNDPTLNPSIYNKHQ